MNCNISTQEWVARAYKKLKQTFYFDKTQLPLIEQIVAFESAGVEEGLMHLAEALELEDDLWGNYVVDIISKIDTLVFPKKLSNKKEDQVIFNMDNEPLELERAQYMVHMPVIGHILGTIWVLVIGPFLDNRDNPDDLPMYDHSYGNRLRKNLYDNESGNITDSPYLFEPYFSQYENWRDTALKYAKERLSDKQDALVLTLDLRSFYYSVHIPSKRFDEIYKEISPKKNFPKWLGRIHDFVYRVMSTYSKKVRDINKDENLKLGERVFLPIGFLPSNILSNWILTPFDEVINARINPVYYGRYVDDIIIVDKVEKNSPLRKMAQGKSIDNSILTAQDVIEHYFCSCLGMKESLDVCKGATLFSIVDDKSRLIKQKCQDPDKCKDQTCKIKSPVYRINHSLFPKDDDSDVISEIMVQNDKVKVFYFREGGTRALIDCFLSQIGQNASEFRFLPEMETMLGKNDYSEIFKLRSSDTPNKLNGVSEVSLDKLSLSKFLGKYRKAGRMIRDRKESSFDRDLLTILNKRTLIENYILWERLLEIMIVNDNIENYEKLIKKILKAIAEYSVPTKKVLDNGYNGQHALLLTLRSAICRTSALYWGPRMNKVLNNISNTEKNNTNNMQKYFPEELFENQRKFFCTSCMINKYVLPIPIRFIDNEVFSSKVVDINLTHSQDFLLNTNWNAFDVKYEYLPYMVTPQEISYTLACNNIAKGDCIDDAITQIDNIKKYFGNWNNFNRVQDNNEALTEIKVKSIIDSSRKCFAISVETPAVKQIKVAVGNARLSVSDFTQVLKNKPNRSYTRYQQVSKLLREALEEKVDILVLPENFLPWEWLPDISRLCANNQMALITGVEHILSSKNGTEPQKVYNLTAVILPYVKDSFKFSHVVYHHKVHYSPLEKRKIQGYRMEPYPGNQYQLFQWKDLWFSVYCCFELASINDRSLFKSYADLTVAVEWNSDVIYFSNIIESLCRDLHCYCIQVNSSNYGDSRVISPSKTELRDIIKTKGGLNPTILVDEINIDDLRDFQRKEYELQKEDDRFKPTPPSFMTSVPEHKQNRTLWEHFDELIKIKE